MNQFHRLAATRIAAVSVLLAAISSPVAWFVTLEKYEEGNMALATEESQRIIDYHHANDLGGADGRQNASNAAKAITGGLFDIAEIYGRDGEKLAESTTVAGKAIEKAIPHHGRPSYTSASHYRFNLPDGAWALRIFVPLRDALPGGTGAISGYFEGVRLVPHWEKDQIFYNALTIALMVSLASLLCGAALYPVVVRLAAENASKTREVLASQEALIEGLRQSEVTLEGKVAQRTGELQAEQVRTRELLHNMLPVDIAEELSQTGVSRAVRHESVSVLFTDFCDFTQAAATMPADRMVAELNEIFVSFDDIADACGVEKIKTIGDAYMAAAGLPKPCADHAHRCVRAGMRMVAYIEHRNQSAPFKWAIRVGVHSGPVVAGVVGRRKYAFDIWGDTVNIASRMESAGEPGRVNVSAYTCDLIRDEFDCAYRGKVQIKGKGQADMYFVTGTHTA